MSTIIKLDTKKWYSHEMKFNIELMCTYIKNVEKQVNSTIKNYHKKKETLILEENPEYGYAKIISIYSGLDNETWDIDGIFLEHFPTLQRSSALITLFSFLEHELDKLCLLFQKTKSLRLELKDINGKGIERSTNYLEKVAGIKTLKNSIEWEKINDTRKIRNIFVHNNGKLFDIKGNISSEKFKLVEKAKFLSGESEINIKEGFLEDTLETFDSYFKLIDKSIQIEV